MWSRSLALLRGRHCRPPLRAWLRGQAQAGRISPTDFPGVAGQAGGAGLPTQVCLRAELGLCASLLAPGHWWWWSQAFGWETPWAPQHVPSHRDPPPGPCRGSGPGLGSWPGHAPCMDPHPAAQRLSSPPGGLPTAHLLAVSFRGSLGPPNSMAWLSRLGELSAPRLLGAGQTLLPSRSL